MLSYALASLKIDQSRYVGESTSRMYRGTGRFGFIKNREFSIIKELGKYGKSSQETIDRLNKILDKNDFYVKMLVAADIWYIGNDMPKIFTPEMFTSENPHFMKISNISFSDNKVWDRDSLATLMIYANYLRTNIYKESGEIKIIDDDDSEDDFYYGENDVDL